LPVASPAGPGGPFRVLIVGGGTAGWMTAAALSRLLPPQSVTLRLVESTEIGTVGVGEATVPHIRFFNAKLGFDEAEFMAKTRATFKLGIEFRNWFRLGDAYIHPFGAFGRELHGVPFHHHWVRARRAGCAESIEEYSLPILAARRGKFAYPDEDPAAPRSTYSYAFQFDAGLYAAFLRAFAEARGVLRSEGRIVDVELDGQSGFVERVVLESGERVAADLFIDCSGFRGLLIEQALHAGYEDWTHWLPCDRAYAVPCAATEPVRPLTRSTAHESGWFWRIPLQHRVGNGHVYSSAFVSDDEALAALLAQIESPQQSEPRQLRFTTGKRKKQWSRNVVSIGLAAGFLEPLESTSIHLIQLAIGYLIDLFPDRGFDAVNETEFNRIMALEYERVRDFIILHYHSTEREDTPFWNYCRSMQVPDSLAYRLELFRERGVVAQYREGMFLDASWLAVLFGQHVVPRHYDPASDRLLQSDLQQRLAGIRVEYAQAVATMPPHDAFLRQIGADYQTRGFSSAP
jgi:tryptophan 7-halogenase